MTEFTCGHKPWMGVRCDECSPKLTPEQAIGIGRGTYCPSCAALRAKMERYENALRKIAGELGEFADADGETMVEKIRFLRASLAKKEEEVKRLRASYEAMSDSEFLLRKRLTDMEANELRRRAGKGDDGPDYLE